MCFSAENKTAPCILLSIDGEAIAEVFKSKYLGMVIANKWVRKVIYLLCVERSRVVSGYNQG